MNEPRDDQDVDDYFLRGLLSIAFSFILIVIVFGGIILTTRYHASQAAARIRQAKTNFKQIGQSMRKSPPSTRGARDSQ